MQPKKRLLVYATQMLATGGIESHLKEFIKNLYNSGTCIIDFVVAYSEMEETQISEIKKYCNKIFLGKSKKDTPKNLIKLKLKYAFQKYDCLYTNGQGNSIILVSKCFRYNKWVHHHHTSGDALDQKEWSKWYIKAMKAADTVIACSKTNAQDIAKALNRNIDVIYCFSRKVNITNKHNKTEIIKLGYFGRLIPEKGIDILAKLSNDPECSSISFNIWGKGEVYTPSFFNENPLLHYHGSFDGIEGLTNVIESLDGFLLLSSHPEGLPVCLLEVMGAGLPWLATPKGGIKDIVIDNFNTEICDNIVDYEETKAAVIKFKENIAKQQTNSETLENYYNHKFAKNILVKEWVLTLFNLHI